MRMSDSAGIVVLVVAALCGCASGITNIQEQELHAYRAKGYYVQEKNPGTAAAMGILPGGGSFYTRNYGVGVLNLLFWPLSILWDPVSGTNGANSLNYAATKANIEKLRRKELRDLEEQLATGKIDNARYIVLKNELERKYEP